LRILEGGHCLRVRVASFTSALVASAVLHVGTLQDDARGQDFSQIFRGDEVGRSELDFDEETFLNILSFEQPLEMVQPFLAADAGWYAALGSLRADTLWLQQDLKAKAQITDTFAVRGQVRQGVDLDTDFTRLQATMEMQFGDHWYAGLPVYLGLDKGTMDGGVNTTWRDPSNGIDYAMFQWVRSDLVFNQRSDEFADSEVKRPADNLELQAQADLFGFGRTTVEIADELPSKVEFVETQQVQQFSRFTAWLMQAFEVDPSQRLFFRASYEIASESSVPTGPLGTADAFDGDRDVYSARLEYQRDLDEEKTRRMRVGSTYLNFREDSEEANDPKDDFTELRREAVVYGGYRSPLADSKEIDLETVVYLDRLWNSRRFPNAPNKSEQDPDFQGKVSFYFRWHVADRAEFVLAPSFELDNVGWGGGAFQLRYRL
jgi:hypothetical protein